MYKQKLRSLTLFILLSWEQEDTKLCLCCCCRTGLPIGATVVKLGHSGTLLLPAGSATYRWPGFRNAQALLLPLLQFHGTTNRTPGMQCSLKRPGMLLLWLLPTDQTIHSARPLLADWTTWQDLSRRAGTGIAMAILSLQLYYHHCFQWTGWCVRACVLECSLGVSLDLWGVYLFPVSLFRLYALVKTHRSIHQIKCSVQIKIQFN